jgi:hypothetical protein
LAWHPFASLRRCAPLVLRASFGTVSNSEDDVEPGKRARVPAMSADQVLGGGLGATVAALLILEERCWLLLLHSLAARLARLTILL